MLGRFLLVMLAACGVDAPERQCVLAFATRAGGQLVASSQPAAGPGSCVLTMPDDARAGEIFAIEDGIEPSRTARSARLRFTSESGEGMEATRGSVTVTSPGPPTLDMSVDAVDEESPGLGSISGHFLVPIL